MYTIKLEDRCTRLTGVWKSPSIIVVADDGSAHNWIYVGCICTAFPPSFF